MVLPLFFFAIWLFAQSIRLIVGGFLDALQFRLLSKKRIATEQKANAEISQRLRQTYLELSLSRRQSIWREVLVVKVVQESEDVRSFYLVDKEYDPLPASLPGQHILVERPKKDGYKGGFRCYSLSDDCSAGHWRISVKKNSSHPESVSRWLHEEIAAGDTIRARGPSGAFYLQTKSDRNVVLVSAGIGVTPMLPMLIESLRHSCSSIHCFAQFRDVAHMPFADSLVSLAKRHPQISMNIWISRFPKGVKKSSGGMFFEGKFQASDLVEHDGGADSSDFYLCGPEEWQEKLCAELGQAGVRSESIRYELFQQSEKPVATAGGFVERSIHFKQSNAKAKFQASDQSLLVCAGKNSVSLDSGCRTGACGSCAVKLLSGKVRYTREPQFQTSPTEILACVCVPDTDIEVDA